MISEEKQIILRVLGTFTQTGAAEDSQVKVVRLADNKTSTVEQIAESNRSIMLNEYRLDNRVIWAGYSSRTGVVYLSLKS